MEKKNRNCVFLFETTKHYILVDISYYKMASTFRVEIQGCFEFELEEEFGVYYFMSPTFFYSGTSAIQSETKA